MKVYLNRITGIDDAIVTMFISKGNWTRELEMNIRNLCDRVLDRNGKLLSEEYGVSTSDIAEFKGYMDKLLKWGWLHITMLRFIDLSISVDGLHRGGQDDWDSHAQRFNNRIIRLSTRVKALDSELSDFYKETAIPTDDMLSYLGIDLPQSVQMNGRTYVKSKNGYVEESKAGNPDTMRGLYMLGLSSMFEFKVNLTEYAHVYKERNKDGGANPEVKELAESIADQMERFYPGFNRELLLKIKN